MTTEFVYTWPDGREEVRYRRPKDSADALELVEHVMNLQRAHGADCPYSFRHVHHSVVPIQECRNVESDLLHAARRVLSANQEAQPMEYHAAIEELKRAVENADRPQ